MKKTLYFSRILTLLFAFTSFPLFGCSGIQIKLINTELKVSNIIKQPYINNVEGYSEEIKNDVYYRFDFETDMPLIELAGGIASRVQTRLKFTKGGKEVFYDIQHGPYSISENRTLNENLRENRYSSLFLRSLAYYSHETRLSKPIEELDFDYMEIKVVFPVPILGYVFQSNITTYSRDYVLKQMSKERETLSIVDHKKEAREKRAMESRK